MTMSAAQISIQVASAVLATAMIWFITYQVVVRVTRRTEPVYFRKQVRVVDGYVDLSAVSDRQWSTADPTHSSYLPITRSVNRGGGSQFSYSFWMKTNASKDPASLANHILLLRGDPTPTYVERTEFTTQQTSQLSPEPLVQCPCIKFGASTSEMVISMNTTTSPYERFVVGDRPPSTHRAPTDQYNALNVVQGQWTLYTITFEDNMDINNFATGLVVRFYVNDSLYDSYRSASKLRLNQGKLYLSPNRRAESGSVIIGDVSYFNRALNPEDVRVLFEQGPPKKAAKDISVFGPSHETSPRYLTEYNKLDLKPI